MAHGFKQTILYYPLLQHNCIVLSLYRASMETEPRNNNQETEQSFAHVDFVPPEHSYIVNEQFNSAFFKDHCEEEYTIHRAFNASNFTGLRKNIPNALKHGAILDHRIQQVQRNMNVETSNRQKPATLKEEEHRDRVQKRKLQKIGQLGYFQTFPYVESQYDIEHELSLKQQQSAKDKQESISPLDFRPAGFDKKLKGENPFTFIDKLQAPTSDKEEYLFPFHLPEDTYDRFHQSELRNRIIQESAKLGKDFIPAGNEKSLTKITRSRAGEILKELEEYLKKYMVGTGFFIGMSKRDYIDILFESKETENNKLQLVMSRLCEHQTLSHFILRRNVKKWGKLGANDYLEFCLLPPWVRDPEEKLSKE